MSYKIKINNKVNNNNIGILNDKMFNTSFVDIKNIFNFLLKGKYIVRWNEFARPIEFTVLDREALKIILAIFLSQENKNIDIKKLLQISFASLIRKLILTDIKNSIYDKLKKYHGFELNRYIVNYIENNKEINLDNDILYYVKNYDNLKTKEKILLDIAGYIATGYEFNLLNKLNSDNFEFKKIFNTYKKDEKKYKKYKEYIKYTKKKKMYKNIFDVINNLRYQKRGIRLPLINNFSILEHLYITSFITYCLLRKSSDPIKNNFNLIIIYSLISLFHDIPEALTRDIITPVKKSTNEIDKTIFKLEKKLIKKYFLKKINNKIFRQNIYNIIFSLNKYKYFSYKKNKINLGKKIKFYKKSFHFSSDMCVINKEFLKYIDEIFALLETIEFNIKENDEVKDIITRIKNKYNII